MGGECRFSRRSGRRRKNHKEGNTGEKADVGKMG